MQTEKTGTETKPLKVGRNQQCPCGSNKKFKKCCERVDLIDPKDPVLDLEKSPEYTDPMAQFGVANNFLLHENGTLLQLKRRADMMLEKIQKRWVKKRVLQIGIFEDTLAAAHVFSAYSKALESEAIKIAAELTELKGEVKPIELPVEPPVEIADEVIKESEGAA